MTAEPNTEALEMTACMLYKMSSESTPERWRAAWEHLHPDVRAEYRQAARKIITTYLDFLPAWTIDENALEIAQSEARRMPTADGFKTMARHLVTTYELHRQAGTRAAPPVAPPGAAAILKILDAHKARTTGHVYCNCGQLFKTDQKHRNHIAQQIAEAKNEK